MGGLPGKALISLSISTRTNVYTHNHISYAIGTTMDKSYKVRFIGDKLSDFQDWDHTSKHAPSGSYLIYI